MGYVLRVVKYLLGGVAAIVLIVVGSLAIDSFDGRCEGSDCGAEVHALRRSYTPNCVAERDPVRGRELEAKLSPADDPDRWYAISAWAIPGVDERDAILTEAARSCLSYDAYYAVAFSRRAEPAAFDRIVDTFGGHAPSR